MSLPINSGAIPIDPSTGQRVPLCDVLNQLEGKTTRQSFSVVGANVDTLDFSLDRGEISILDFAMITMASTNDNLTTVWHNLSTAEEVSRRFYLAGALNSVSPYNCSCEIVEFIYETEITDEKFVNYVNNGINGIVKDVNDGHQQYIMQTVEATPPPSIPASEWNGVTEEQYQVGLVNDAIWDYVGDPDDTAKQAALNAAIADYETYAQARNTMIDQYNGLVQNYNNNVGFINQQIEEYNKQYEGYLLFGETLPNSEIRQIPLLEPSTPEYSTLPIGLPTSPTPVTIPVNLSQYISIEIPIVSDVYLVHKIMNFFLKYPYNSDPQFGLGANVQNAIDNYNNDYVINPDPPPATVPNTEQLAVDTLNEVIAEYNEKLLLYQTIPDEDNTAALIQAESDLNQAITDYNTNVNSNLSPIINDFNTSVIDGFNAGNITVVLTTPPPIIFPFTVTIPESRPEIINQLINVTNPFIGTTPEFLYTPYPDIDPNTAGVQPGIDQRDPMQGTPIVNSFPNSQNVDPLDFREPYLQLPDFTPPLVPDDKYTEDNIALLQEIPFTDVTGIPPTSTDITDPIYSDPTQFSTINSYFDGLNTAIDDYNATQVSPENNAIIQFNIAINNWNNSAQTQADLDLLILAHDIYLAESLLLDVKIEEINDQVNDFNTGPPVPHDGGEYLADLNAEIARENLNREAYGLPPIPLYTEKPLRELMPGSYVSGSLTLQTAPRTIELISGRDEYPKVPEMTQDTINDNFIVSNLGSIVCNFEDLKAFTIFQFNDPDFQAWRTMLTTDGLNIAYNTVVNKYLEAGSGPWPSTTYFGVPPPPTMTSNLSIEGQRIMNEWISQVIASMPYDLTVAANAGVNDANTTSLQAAIDEFNAYVDALNTAIDDYNNSIDAINERVGELAWTEEDTDITFSTYGTYSPPSGIYSSPQTITELNIFPPPVTTTTETQTYMRIDQTGVDIVDAWLQQILDDATISQQDKNSAQAEADAYKQFAETSIPSFLPNSLNGYARGYNDRYRNLGLVGPLAIVNLLEEMGSVTKLPDVTDASVNGFQITNTGSVDPYTAVNGPITISDFNAYQVTGFLYSIANGSIQSLVFNDLDALNTDIADYNTNGRPAEQDIIDSLNNAVDNFNNNTTSSNYFDQLAALQSADVEYGKEVIGSVPLPPPQQGTYPPPPSFIVNSTIDQFNGSSLNFANNGSSVGPGVAGFLLSANEILETSSINIGEEIIPLPELDNTSPMPQGVDLTPPPIPNNLDNISTDRPLYPTVNFSTNLGELVGNEPVLLPLYFTVGIPPIDPVSQGYDSDLAYIREKFYNELVGIPYPDASISTIPTYNDGENPVEGILAETIAVEALNVAIQDYQDAADAFLDPNSNNYNDATVLQAASNTLKAAVGQYVNDIGVKSNSVNSNIEELNEDIDAWTAALEDANERLEFWGFPPLPDVYEINSRSLMEEPPVPVTYQGTSNTPILAPLDDYDPNAPPSSLIERDDQKYPYHLEDVLDENDNPILIDEDGNVIETGEDGEPVNEGETGTVLVAKVPIGLDLNDFINEAADQQNSEDIAARIASNYDLIDLLENLEHIVRFRVGLSGKRKERPQAYIAEQPQPSFTGASTPTVGLVDLAVGFSAPRYRRLISRDVISASRSLAEAKNTPGFQTSLGFEALLELGATQLAEKVKFYGFTDAVSSLFDYENRLPSLVDVKEEVLTDLFQGVFALNVAKRAVELATSDIPRQLLLNLFGTSSVSGRVFNLLGNDLPFYESFIKVFILTKALIEFGAGVFPPEFLRSLLEGVPALRDFLGSAEGGINPNTLQGRVKKILSNVDQDVLERIKPLSIFRTPKQFTLASQERTLRGLQGQIPVVWPASPQTGDKLYQLPKRIIIEGQLRKSTVNREIGKGLLNDLTLANTVTPPPPPPSPPPQPAPKLPEPTVAKTPPAPPAFDPQADGLKKSLESFQVNSAQLKKEIVDAGTLKANILGDDLKSRLNAQSDQASRTLKDQIASDARAKQARDQAIANDRRTSDIQSDAASQSARDSAEAQARLSKQVADDAAKQQAIDDDYLATQRQAKQASQDSFERAILNNNIVSEQQLRNDVEGDLINKKILEGIRAQKQALEEYISSGNVDDQNLKRSIESALISLGFSTITARREAKKIGFDSEQAAVEESIAAQELKEEVIADQLNREAILRDHLIRSERGRQRVTDHVQKRAENRERRRKAIQEDIQKLQNTLNENMNQFLKGIHQDKKRKLSIQFRDFILDMENAAREKSKAKAGVYLAGGTDSISPKITRSIDIDI